MCFGTLCHTLLKLQNDKYNLAHGLSMSVDISCHSVFMYVLRNCKALQHARGIQQQHWRTETISDQINTTFILYAHLYVCTNLYVYIYVYVDINVYISDGRAKFRRGASDTNTTFWMFRQEISLQMFGKVVVSTLFRKKVGRLQPPFPGSAVPVYRYTCIH